MRRRPAKGMPFANPPLLDAAGVKRTVGQKAIRDHRKDGRLIRIGPGNRTGPYLYWRPSADDDDRAQEDTQAPTEGEKDSAGAPVVPAESNGRRLDTESIVSAASKKEFRQKVLTLATMRRTSSLLPTARTASRDRASANRQAPDRSRHRGGSGQSSSAGSALAPGRSGHPRRTCETRHARRTGQPRAASRPGTPRRSHDRRMKAGSDHLMGESGRRDRDRRGGPDEQKSVQKSVSLPLARCASAAMMGDGDGPQVSSLPSRWRAPSRPRLVCGPPFPCASRGSAAAHAPRAVPLRNAKRRGATKLGWDDLAIARRTPPGCRRLTWGAPNCKLPFCGKHRRQARQTGGCAEEVHERPERLTATQKMLEVLCSVVLGDADKDDIIDLLNRDEADSLESVTRVLTRGEPTGAREAPRRPRR